MSSDVVHMKLDMFKGKRKVKDRWSKVEYVVTHQVTSDMPTYEVKGDGGNIMVTHHNKLFLVAPVRETAIPLGRGKSVSFVSATWSALAEFTPLECGGEMSESKVEGALTRHPQPCSAWLGGWCCMAPTISGPETNRMWVRIW